MPIKHITIPTPGTDCPAYLVCPTGDGPWPAAVFYGDAGGMRPAMLEMATRLSEAGYVVLLPDLYYRFGPYELARRLRADPATRSLYLIALTGYGQYSDRQRALSAGFDDHMTKPAKFEVLEEALVRALPKGQV